jgi:ABC-type polysaccharide/polyol phosphate transport system ATPase subunit
VATIQLEKISVDIPVYDIGASSLRKFILGKTIGGRFAKVGNHVIVNALKRIDFEAHDGDRIGLIGNNGSGKTTLLRVLAQVYPPTQGKLTINGRVSPMLDAMLGMTPDATGMENIYICGVLWGLSRKQVDASVDDVAGFTELGDYLKMPVRTYSSGMQLRLAFAIATLREPDILLLDEVIGVGDAVFYQKAQARLQNLIERSRILFVASHSNEMIAKLCNKAIWLSEGNLIRYGKVADVLASYEKAAAELRQAQAH